MRQPRAYRQAVAIRPDLAELWSNLGLMQYQSSEYSEAEEAFRKGLAINQALFVPNLFLGLDLLHLKRPREAVPYLVAAGKLNPNDPQPALALGRAFHALWEPQNSRDAFRRAIAVDARNGEAWYGLGLAYFGVAESAGERLTKAFARSAYVAELSASAFVEQGRLPEAMHAYGDLLAEKEPLPRCSRTAYGFALLRHGERPQAEQQFRLDMAACPAARVGQARLWFDSGQREKAMAILEELSHSDPASFRLALPRFWDGLDTQGLQVVLRQLRQSPNPVATVAADAIRGRFAPAARNEHPPRDLAKLAEPDLQQFAGDAFFSGDFPAAALAADRLRQRFPNHAAGWYWAVRVYQKLGVEALARAGEVEPDSPRVHALLGDAYQRRKMFPEAQEEYSKMLALVPDNIAGLAGLAAAYFADSRLEEARDMAARALARDPADREINFLMGDILVAQHEYENAEPYLQRSLHARADLVPRAHALLGRVYANTGRSNEAILELEQGLASDEDGSVYFQLARLYQEAGDARAAAAALDKSKQLHDQRDALAREMLTPVR